MTDHLLASPTRQILASYILYPSSLEALIGGHGFSANRKVWGRIPSGVRLINSRDYQPVLLGELDMLETDKKARKELEDALKGLARTDEKTRARWEKVQKKKVIQ